MAVLPTGWSLLAAVSLLWPGIGTADPDAKLPAGFEGERMLFELIVLSPVVLLLVLCGVFFALGARTRRVARTHMEMSV